MNSNAKGARLPSDFVFCDSMVTESLDDLAISVLYNFMLLSVDYGVAFRFINVQD